MRQRAMTGLLALLGVFASFVAAQETKGISWKHGLSFQVRKAGQTAFEGANKYGAEVFLDRDLNQAVYITEKATLGLGSAAKLTDSSEVKAPLLLHAVELRVRPAGEASFEKAKKVSAEVFKDPNADNVVYISETGSVGVIPAGNLGAPDKVKDPTWFHGLEVRVRKAGEKEFSDMTRKVSLEVYKDENTNQLVYATHDGDLAVLAAGTATKPAEIKNPIWYHAFELKVRLAKEEKFGKDTKSIGVEVYKDDNTGNLIYVSETGSIAVVPGTGVSKPSNSKDAEFKFGRAFRVRKADEPDFNDKTQRFGAEVYKDDNTGNLVYITETGALAVIPGK